MIESHGNPYSIFFKPGGIFPARWGIGPNNLPIVDGGGIWDTTIPNWHKITDSVKTRWKDRFNAIIGGGTTGAFGTITVTGNRTADNLIFDEVFGGGFYTLNNGSIRLNQGGITVNNTDGVTMNTGISGNAGLTKSGNDLRLTGNTGSYTFTGKLNLVNGIIDFQGTWPFTTSNSWDMNVQFPPTLANSGRFIFSNNPDLTGINIDLKVTGTAVGRWVAGTWTGTIGGTLIVFRVNGVGTGGGAIPSSSPYFRYMSPTQVFYYQPRGGTGAGQINPAFGIVNNWSNAFVDRTSGTGTFTVPAGVYVVKAWCIGAGGAGGGTDDVNNNAGGGGGGGGSCWKTFNVSPGDIINYTVGNGGAGNDNQDGNDGTDSRVRHDESGTLLRADGGRGGGRHKRPPNGTANGGAGGAAGTGGDGSIKGGNGGTARVTTTVIESASGGAFGNVNGLSVNGSSAGVNANKISLSNYAFNLTSVNPPFKSGNGPRNGNGGNGDNGCGGGGAGAENTSRNRGGRGGDGLVLIAW